MCELDHLTDMDHVMAVGTYVITQPTKDGKSVMPYDYRWGSGSMYFRTGDHIPIWLESKGVIKNPVPIATCCRLPESELRKYI